MSGQRADPHSGGRCRGQSLAVLRTAAFPGPSTSDHIVDLLEVVRGALCPQVRSLGAHMLMLLLLPEFLLGSCLARVLRQVGCPPVLGLEGHFQSKGGATQVDSSATAPRECWELGPALGIPLKCSPVQLLGSMGSISRDLVISPKSLVPGRTETESWLSFPDSATVLECGISLPWL